VTTRKLEEIASHLDDMSVTLEEIREEIKGNERDPLPTLEKVQADMERAADVIEDVVDPDRAEKR
jgi:hypothetical protein